MVTAFKEPVQETGTHEHQGETGQDQMRKPSKSTEVHTPARFSNYTDLLDIFNFKKKYFFLKNKFIFL